MKNFINRYSKIPSTEPNAWLVYLCAYIFLFWVPVLSFALLLAFLIQIIVNSVNFIRKNGLNIFSFKIVIALSLLIIAVAVSWYLVVYIPRQNKETIQAQKDEEEHKFTRSTELQKQCLDQADSDYSEYWSQICEAQAEKDGCLLTAEKTNIANTYRSQLRNECFQKYPIK